MRPRSLPCVLAVALFALFALTSLLVPSGVQEVMLGVLPLVVLMLALARSPDLGTERLRRWVARLRAPRRRPQHTCASPAPARDRVRRGGLLVACSLAERGPPARFAPLAA